jgi:hypothetical protein
MGRVRLNGVERGGWMGVKVGLERRGLVGKSSRRGRGFYRIGSLRRTSIGVESDDTLDHLGSVCGTAKRLRTLKKYYWTTLFIPRARDLPRHVFECIMEFATKRILTLSRYPGFQDPNGCRLIRNSSPHLVYLNLMGCQISRQGLRSIQEIRTLDTFRHTRELDCPYSPQKHHLKMKFLRFGLAPLCFASQDTINPFIFSTPSTKRAEPNGMKSCSPSMICDPTLELALLALHLECSTLF